MTNTLDRDSAAESTHEVVPSPQRVTGSRQRRGSDAHEREADRTADAILNGATGVATGLSRTSAAPRPAARTAGVPLAADLLRDLADAFGADLEAVRIHTDPAADSLAAAERARAFTAGAHIFFRTGEFDPSSLDGRRLLLHEITHVLQQTARASTTGRPRAVDLASSGHIQAEDEDDFDAILGSRSPRARFGLLSQVHAGAENGFIRRTTTALGGVIDPNSDSFMDFAEAAAGGRHGATQPHELSFLFDVLKAGEAFDAAAEVLNADDNNVIRTMRYSHGVAAALVDPAHRDEALELADLDESLAALQQQVLAAAWSFLRNPDGRARRVGNLHGSPPPRIAERPSWNPLLWRNERDIFSVISIAAVDEFRFEASEHAIKSGELAGDVVVRGSNRAEQFVHDLQTAEDVNPLQQRLIGELVRRGEWASQFWTDARQRVNEQALRRVVVRAGDVDQATRRQLRLAAQRPRLRRALDTVVTAGLEFLHADEPGVPGPDQYLARAETYRSAILDAYNAARPEMDRLLRNDRRRAEALSTVDLLERLEMLAITVGGYDREAERLEDEPGDTPFADRRLAHRVDVAVELRRLGIEYGRDELEAPTVDVLRAARVREARAAGDQSDAYNVLLLIADWAPDTSAPLSQFEQEMSHGVLINDVVIPARMITDFFRTRTANGLSAEIERLVELGDDSGAPPSDRYVLQRAFELARTIPEPVRWGVDEFLWTPHDGDERTVNDIISLHPKTIEQVKPQLGNDVLVLPGVTMSAAREDSPRLNAVYAWQLPDLSMVVAEIVSQLRQVPLFVEAAGPLDAGGPSAWLARLQEWIADGDEETNRRRQLLVGQQLESESASRLESAQRRLGTLGDTGGLLRVGTNHDRLVHRGLIVPMLKAYRDGDIRQFDQPRLALGQIRNFLRYALPAQDNIAQLAALLIEMAEDLDLTFNQRTMFGLVTIHEDNYDLVTGYWGLIALAIAWAEDSENRKRLRATGTGEAGVAILPMNDKWFNERLVHLRAVRDGFNETRQRVSRGRGFKAAPDLSGFQSLNYASVVPRGEPFGIEDHRTWEIGEIRTEFRYQPEYGEADPQLRDVESSRQGPFVFGQDNQELPPDTPLFSVRINGGQLQWIRARDLDELELIWRAVEDKAFQISMENLEAAMVASLGLALDLAELIPGAGQVLMVGRILASISMFLASADFEDIKSALRGEVVEQIRGLVDDLDHALSPERLWDYLLFGNAQALSRLQGHRSDRARRGARRRRGVMGAVLRTARGLGPFLARQAEQLSVRVQRPLRDTQSFIQLHPPLITAVMWAARLAEMAPELANRVAEIQSEIGDAQAGLEQRVTTMANALQEFEVPREIVPNALVAEAIIGMILDRLGGKGRVARRILEGTSLLSEAGQLVAEALEGSDADPNEYWRDHMHGKANEVLTTARNDLVQSLHLRLDAVGFGHLIPNEPANIELPFDEDLQIDADESADQRDANEPLVPAAETAEPQPESDPDVGSTAQPTGDQLDLGEGDAAASGIAATAKSDAGSAIPRDVLADVQSRFGHDFSDVRLHTGTAADAVTGPISADGVTSGSHVFLRPGLSIRSDRGAHVLRHELTHVLQQTGGRPGPRQPAMPGVGSGDSREVVWDSSAESEAEAVATQTRAGDAGEVNVAASGSGMQPAIDARMASRILRRMASYQDLRDYQRDIAEELDPSVEPLTDTQKRAVDGLKTQLREALKDATITAGPARLRNDIAEHTKARAEAIFANNQPYVERMARQSLVRRPLRRNSNQRQTWEFRQRRFMTLVDSYLLVRGGILVDFDLSPAVPGQSGTVRRITGATVTRLFMGGMTRSMSRGGLWTKLLSEQFSSGTTLTGSTPPQGSTFPRHQLVIGTDRSQDIVYRALVDRLRRVGPRSESMDQNAFRLDERSVVQPVVDNLMAHGDQAAFEQAARDLPPAREYTHGSDLPAHGIAIRSKTHYELRRPTTPGRESHHTTQFLFSEFFTHEKTGRFPFRSDDPGVQYAGGQPAKVLNSSGDEIDLEGLRGGASGRGDPMPAILIADVTHRLGKLHVSASSPDEADVGDDTGYAPAGASQTTTVARWWRDAEPRVRPEGADAAPAATTSVPLTGSRSASATRRELSDPEKGAAADRLFNAVQATYHEMKGTIMPALETALSEHEAPYYTGLARAKHPPQQPDDELPTQYQLKEPMLAHAYSQAVSNNDTVMGRYGFTAQ